MWPKLIMPTIGVIGYRNHAAKIINLIKKNNYKINLIYHPRKKLNFKNYTNNLKYIIKINIKDMFFVKNLPF